MKQNYLVKAGLSAGAMAFGLACGGCSSGRDARDRPLSGTNPVTVTVNTSTVYQRVAGFGGMANAWNSPVLTGEDIDLLYGPQGLGYNVFRIMIYPDPARWETIVSAAQGAQSYGAIILASPWTPPAALKSNKALSGGYLLPGQYGAYAEHLKSFVQFMQEKGVTINALSLQNEPDIKVDYDSCDWTPAQMGEFIKQYGRSIGGTVKIIPGESFQLRREFTDPILNDSQALPQFDIIGGHIYGGGLKRYDLAEEKGKEVWMTEHLLNSPDHYDYDSTWPAALTAAEEIHQCMTAGFSVYLWWYLKRFYSMLGDGEYGTAAGRVLHRGYVLSHYAKYAAGRDRVEALSGGDSPILASAYTSPGDITLVMINRGDTPTGLEIRLSEPVRNGSAVETGEEGAMQNKGLSLGVDKKSAVLTLEPRTITSVQFIK
jgi:O-glycosyl hydrolase